MIYRNKIENYIKEWLKNIVRLKVGGNFYLKNIKAIDSLCSERSKWITETMDFYAVDIVKELEEI